MRWIDTHCHLDAPEFGGNAAEVVHRARAAGVVQIVVPAVEAANFDTVRELAHEHHLAYALGIHPLYVDRAEEADIDRLADALDAHRHDPRLVAVGEIGLDHFVPGIDRPRQERCYEAQLRLAREAGLPVILHVRRSADTLLKHLRRTPVAGGIAHAFNGSDQQALAFVAMGFKLGFGGAMTFERALQLRRLAQTLPLEAIVLETDAPDIPPHWLYRTAAERRSEPGATAPNEPSQLPRIAQTLAALRGIGLAEIANATWAQACAVLPKLGALQTPAGDPP
ncbi:MAG: DNAase [Burkholderiales bacterium PBB1]|nr:MAG: DNAase [Burkholderiales bacterium PBB1]